MNPSCSKMKTVSLVHKAAELANRTLVFDFEGTLLRSTSLFPYFMLVAFEAGGLLRSFILFLSYPLVWLVGEEHLGLKIMVFLCFFGIKKDTFRIGLAVLPKFFLGDVGWEGFEAVMCYERKVASSKLPRIMVEGFLKDYIGVETVAARDLKSFRGYFMGLFEKNKSNNTPSYENYHKELFHHFKEVYLMSSDERRNWRVLPRERYPKPLIFHDGRLAFRPTPASSLAFFMWLPLALFLSIFRITFGVSLPFNVSAPILALSGTRTTASGPHNSLSLVQNEEKEKGMLYVCNHRTLLDPLYIAYVLDKPLSAVTYSLSRLNELVSPIRTVRLTRDREKDREAMEKLLNLGSLVVCPEGTTCREPYLLRFSPLFAELTDDIVPVAVDVNVSMFYGTTASGHKWLDPFFHLMNPNPTYFIKVLPRLPQSQTCQGGGKSSIEVANLVQNEICNALGFACTNLTRKDKYTLLAGNEGVSPRHNSP
ncbi:probable glycerol-3-phosphate acyltransferase 2 [Gastrolobium bilobum]|uniref:probable glycerol-3-phosphate acyltransferase 2 n=1 Tax=Gastrolobium bilobum TaxID=150636 RepID=UPI002AB119A6|nr:probable glycerol-3-phosphate acyltransferase 2 [Gastrolobium bilobum]